MHGLYFICERKFYARTHVEITRHWKSTLRLDSWEFITAFVFRRTSQCTSTYIRSVKIAKTSHQP